MLCLETHGGMYCPAGIPTSSLLAGRFYAFEVKTPVGKTNETARGNDTLISAATAPLWLFARLTRCELLNAAPCNEKTLFAKAYRGRIQCFSASSIPNRPILMKERNVWNTL
jgi:hypothetical protein